MKNIAKLLVVLVLAFSATSCSKDEANQSENLHKSSVTSAAPTNKIYIKNDRSHIPHLAIMFLEDKGFNHDEIVALTYDNGEGEIGTMEVKAIDGANLVIEKADGVRLTTIGSINFIKGIGDCDLMLKAKNSNIEEVVKVNSKALIIDMKS